MTTSEIARDRWGSFFESFTSDHEGWPTTIAVAARHHNRTTSRIEGNELPLRGMTADLKDKEDTVVITIGGPADDLLTHEIQQVSHIRLTQVDNVPGSTLQIQGKNGQVTTLTVTAPVATAPNA